MFHLRWTEDILAELVYHIRKKHPHYSDAQVGGVRDRIVAVAPHGRIKGYVIDSDLAYTDDYDAHLHAAAEHGGIQYVVTDDKRFLDFAAANDAILTYEVYTADDFLMLVIQSSPRCVKCCSSRSTTTGGVVVRSTFLPRWRTPGQHISDR